MNQSTYLQIGAGLLLLAISLIIILSMLLPLFEEITNLKNKRRDAVKYINRCLSTDNKLDLDAVLITIKSILDVSELEDYQIEKEDKDGK